MRPDPWNLASVEPTQQEAAAAAAGPDHEIRRGTWRPGTDDFTI